MSHMKFAKHLISNPILSQCMIAGAVMIIAASCGLPAGYTAILLPQLQNTNFTSFNYDRHLISWIVSIYPASIPIGTLLSGLLMDKIGRKQTLILSTIPLILSWLLITQANKLQTIIIARVISGISVGLTAVPGQVLIGETADPKLRGLLSGVPYVSYSIGVLLVYILGSYFTWKTVALLCTLLPIMAFWSLMILPKSPTWLIRNNRFNEAYESLFWLRKDFLKAHEEFEKILEATKVIKNQMELKTNLLNDLKTIFIKQRTLKPFIIVNVFNIMQILSGTHLIIFYAIEILDAIFYKTSNSTMDERNFQIGILTAIIRVLFTIIGSMLLYLIGRRPLAIFSSIGTAVSSLTISTLLICHVTVANSYYLGFAILVYIATNTIGFLLLPGILLGELYPMKYRAIAGAITLTFYNLLLSFVTKIFPIVHAAINIEGIFLMFGLCSIISTILFVYYLPETKDKSLIEIEAYFNSNRILLKSKTNLEHN